MSSIEALLIVIALVQAVGLIAIVLLINRFLRTFEVTTTLTYADESSSEPKRKKLALTIGANTLGVGE